MTIDELVQSIPDEESDLRSQLARWIDEWKRSEDSIEKLSYMIGKWHGNVWFKDAQVSNCFWQNLCQFRTEAMDGIDGMTVNERLYGFGLIPQWDAADDIEKLKIRKKLRANA
jgi:hypothetical protein